MALKDEDEDKLSAVEDEASDEGGETVVVDEKAAAKARKAEEAAGEDERVAQDEDEAAGEDDPSDTEAVRVRRREERKQKKERHRVAQQRNQTELRFLRDRNAELERRFSHVEQRTLQTEHSTLDDRVAQVDLQLRNADEIIAEAIGKGDGATFAEAQKIRDELRENKNRLLGRKQAVQKEAQQLQQRQQAPAAPAEEPPNPDMVRHAQAWVAKHPWYRADRSDNDSAVVGAIDDRLVQEGWDPASEDYWTELDARAKQYVPQRYEEPPPARGNGAGNGSGGRAQVERRGPQMANGTRERSLRPGEVYVSPERKQAMVEAGVWDDPTLRNRYLKAYSSYDKEVADGNS